MTPTKARLIISVLSVKILMLFLSFSSLAAEPCEEWIGKAVSVQGGIQVQRTNETTWSPVHLNDIFYIGDMIRARGNSRAVFVLCNGDTLSVDQNTSILFSALEKEQTLLLRLINGAAHFFSHVPRSLKLATPFVNGSVEGTEFYVKVEGDRTLLSIFEGRMLAANDSGSIILTSGQSAIAQAGQAPEARIVAQPRDAVQWALYYPAVLDYRPADFRQIEGKNLQEMIQKSIEFYRAGDLSMSLSSLDEAPEDTRDPRFFTYRAGLLLSVGRVDEAGHDIGTALNLDPSNSHAFALQSIVAMVQNRKDQSLELAEKAVALDPGSSAARVALSYSQQAHFDLEGALNSIVEAVNLAPENALASARLAELWLSLGCLDKALEAAQKAAVLDPDLERTQTVLGFACLTQIKTKESKIAFEKAIALDSAAPLPRLGLGLAKIREGDLQEGRQEIEIAAALDPNSSLIRSYLGKAYFEEKRIPLDEEQFKIAKELDPMDPTPWFYDAISKQTMNRPVEALHDLQKSIELNDNRAVYRSQLMLDEDLAARSAAIARVYGDLGFQQRALIEGWNSVNSDPTNFSAHRFLADSYSVLPRREIARVSELLQSQLLQPANITPVQPRLAESSLFLVAAQGPTGLSFNEFNPIFNLNRFAVQGSGLLAENDTHGKEGVVSGLYNKLSFSAGYSSFDTGGWYENADQKDKIANVFAQYEFTPKTSIQAEYRYRDTEKGDVILRYWEDNRSPFLRQEDKTSEVRLGMRYAFSPGSTLIGNFQYSDAEGDMSDMFLWDSADFGLPSPPVQVFSVNVRDEGAYSGELSYLFRSQHADIVSGAGYFYIDQKITSTDHLIWPGPPPIDFGTSPSGFDQDIYHYNVYLYAYIKPVEKLMITAGASYDFYNADDKDDMQDLERNQFNPKLGIAWYPFEGTTVRGTVFRNFKRTLITDQTLEPTQVTGFNQFFDDSDATDARVYGAGIDRKISQNAYTGAEYFYRDLSVPVFVASAATGELVVKDVDWDEYLGRTYVYYTPHEWLSLRAEYGYEYFKYVERFNPGAEEIKTHRIPLGINFFHPSGLFAGLTGTFYDQSGKFINFITGTYSNADNSFWLFDAALGYRLPKRYGVITAGATNLFNKDDFNYWEVDLKNSRIQPYRQAFIKVTLAF